MISENLLDKCKSDCAKMLDENRMDLTDALRCLDEGDTLSISLSFKIKEFDSRSHELTTSISFV